MPLSAAKFQRLIEHKFHFQQDATHSADHRWYILDGIADLQPVVTKVSHGGKELDDHLLGKIARQLHVRRAFFDAMFACTKDYDAYLSQLQTDPFPPFTE